MLGRTRLPHGKSLVTAGTTPPYTTFGNVYIRSNTSSSGEGIAAEWLLPKEVGRGVERGPGCGTHGRAGPARIGR